MSSPRTIDTGGSSSTIGLLVVPIGKCEYDIGLVAALGVAIVDVLAGLSFGGTGGGPEPAETLRPLPFPRPRMERLEKSGMEGRPIEDEVDLPEKLLPVGEGGGVDLRLESRVMGLLDDDGRVDEGGSGSRSAWDEGESGERVC